jgi:dCTP deaminase
MILSEREAQALLEEGQLLVDPTPDPDSRLWSSTSLDLTLDRVVLEWTPPGLSGTGAAFPPLRPHQQDFNVQGMMEDPQFAVRRVLDDEANPYVLAPWGFVLGFTQQKLRLPIRCRIAARVEGKSSLARLGLGIHVTAPTIHAGFGATRPADQGLPIQLEIYNVGPWWIRLEAGMRICQLIFEEVRERPSAGYAGQFQGQQAFTVPGAPPRPPKGGRTRRSSSA